MLLLREPDPQYKVFAQIPIFIHGGRQDPAITELHGQNYQRKIFILKNGEYKGEQNAE